MKIQIDNEVRDMTPDEEREWAAWHDNAPSPYDASEEDYIQVLDDLGVRLG